MTAYLATIEYDDGISCYDVEGATIAEALEALDPMIAYETDGVYCVIRLYAGTPLEMVCEQEVIV